MTTELRRIELRRGTAAAWISANPTLFDGEAGVESDTHRMKVGDGSTPWNTLEYVDDSGAYVPLPPTAAAIRFVSAGGNDSNDGLSIASAKLTIAGALASLPAGAGKIVVGVGTFSSAGVSARDHTHLDGMGEGITVLTVGTDVVGAVVGGTNFTGFHLSNMTIDGNKANQSSASTRDGARFISCTDLRIWSIIFQNCKEDGLYLSGCTNPIWRDLLSVNNGRNGFACGDNAGTATTGLLADNIRSSGHSGVGSIGLSLEPAYGARVTNFFSNGDYNGLTIVGGASAASSLNTVYATIDQCTANGVVIHPDAAGAQNNRVVALVSVAGAAVPFEDTTAPADQNNVVTSVASAHDPIGWGMPVSIDPILGEGAIAVSAANFAHYFRARGGGSIRKMCCEVVVSSGAMSLGVVRGPKGRNMPTVRTATTGAVATPAAGVVEIDLTAAVVVDGRFDWLAISADNNTATFRRAYASSLGTSNLATGFVGRQGTAHPIPASPSVTAYHIAPIILIGIP